jgi:hypothetical protein
VIPERIRNLVGDGQLTREGRKVLEDWLEECSEDEFDEYLRLKGEEVEKMEDDE